MRISFLGDISFNDAYVDLNQNGENPFERFSSLKDSDFVIGNLECFLEGNQGENTLKVPRLKTKKNTLHWLNMLNVSHVSLANNHIYDNLDDGFQTTTTTLNQLKVDYWGAEMASEPKRFMKVEKDGTSIGILTYADQDTNPCIPENTLINISLFDIDTVLSDIKKHKECCDVLIVYLHWGGKSENISYPERKQVVQAKEMIKHGANLIVGHHSHTIQPFKKNRNGSVYYSLGNFCFADVRYQGKTIKLNKKNLEGLILTINLDKNKEICIERIFIRNVDNRIEVMESQPHTSYIVKSRLYNIITTLLPFLTNLPIAFNKYFKVPIQFLFEGNIHQQLSKLSWKKIKKYIQ